MTFQEMMNWLNANQGILSVLLFLVSLIIGWVTGIFRALIRKPKFKIRVIPKMTFGCVFMTGEKYTPPKQGTYDVHKSAFVIYLEVTNVGSAPSELGKVKIGYFIDDGKRTLFKKRVWITETNILADFIIPTANGQAIKIPNLRQADPLFDHKYNGFLEVGKSIIGAAYFEQYSSWGNHYPRFDEKGLTDIKIEVKDAFGNKYHTKTKVPIRDIQELMRYNPAFGSSYALIDKDPENFDIEGAKEDAGGEKENGG